MTQEIIDSSKNKCKKNPPTTFNPPRKNPLFDDSNLPDLPPPPPSQLSLELSMAREECTLRDYALPNLDLLQG
ncbi:hypothetical protein EPI10_001702 [Gossypium australe]|uniref:Uncharacterized protein n=1 Tax=Gossypium australe TaxID=47621 RepID=A0A5B6VC22_9ROSI|nr:hypothetical protein EPI10_001702 [Gossypium australe]